MFTQTLNSDLSIKNGNGLPLTTSHEQSTWNVNASNFVPKKFIAPQDIKVATTTPIQYNPQSRSFKYNSNTLYYPPAVSKPVAPRPETTSKKIPIIDPKTLQEINLVVEMAKKGSAPIPIVDPKTIKETNDGNTLTPSAQEALPKEDKTENGVPQNHEEPVKDVVQPPLQKKDTFESEKPESTLESSQTTEDSNSEVKTQIDGIILNAVEEIPVQGVEKTLENNGNDNPKIEDGSKSSKEQNSTSEFVNIEPTEADKENNPAQTNLIQKEVLENDISKTIDEIEAKRTYDRDFLMKFQNLCTQRPENLPEIEVALGDEQFDKNSSWQRKNVPHNRSGSRDFSDKDRPRPRKDFPSGQTTPRWNGNKKVGDAESETLRTIKSLMNKITVENFVPISDKIVRIEIPNEKVLSLVIDQIFVKAVSEPHFSSLYADLCSKLSKYQALQVSESTDAKFRKLLLNKCQQEFENRPPSLIVGTEKPELEVDEQEFKRRHRIFGNMKLIGELYKKGMLQDPVMIGCLKSLLSNGNLDQVEAEDIECLCSLLQTIGRKLDTDRNANIFNTIFEMIASLHSNPSLAARIRFALLDLIELRKYNWTPRRKEEGPKKINDIHKEAAEEYQTQNLRPALSTPKQLKEKSENQRGQPPVDSWQPAPSRKSHAEVLKTAKNKKDEKKNTPQTKKESAKTVQPNAYDLLHDQHKPKNAKAATPNGKSDQTTVPPTTTGSKVKKAMTYEELNSKLTIIVEEYLNSEEVEEAGGYVKDLNAGQLLPSLIKSYLLTAIDKSNPSDRNKLSHLLLHLNNTNVATSQDISQGFRQLFEELEDMSIDIPRAPENAAFLFADSVLHASLDVHLLHHFAPLWSPSPFGEKFLSAFLKAALQMTDEQRLKEEVVKWQLDLSKFLFEEDQSPSSLQSFLEKHSLTFLAVTSS